jgi:hypothetical protein
MITIRTYKDNGPDFPPTKGCYQAVCLRDVLFHVRLAMKDGEDYIGAFNEEGTCYGAWERDTEPVFDKEINWFVPYNYYLFRRPGGPMAGQFNAIAALMR